MSKGSIVGYYYGSLVFEDLSSSDSGFKANRKSIIELNRENVLK